MTSQQASELDIVMPVYNEGENITLVLDSLQRGVRTPFRVLICYDHDADTTLAALRGYRPRRGAVVLVKNQGKGALGAVVSGFRASAAPAVLVMPADDDYNAPRIDALVEKFRQGCDIVCCSRFMPGGVMAGCPRLKAFLCRATSFFMHRLLGVPTRDVTNGFRLFSRRVIDELEVESTAGFAYSLELLVKCHRLGWRIAESPVHWYERKAGTSRFRIFKWAPHYLRWVAYGVATALLRRGPQTVRRRAPSDTLGRVKDGVAA